MISDKKFKNLTTQINRAIIKNDGLIGDQKAQVELMFSLERKFQFYIHKYQQSNVIYSAFINKINNSNILTATSYFRERATVFRNSIIQDLKDGDVAKLKKYHMNFLMIDFLVKKWKGKLPERARLYYRDYLEARRILIENNIPLAINRAKLFFRKTPTSSLTLIDLIDISICGLITGIDKYVGKYKTVWRSVCIGRMVRNMMYEYSDTFLKLYPSDKQILYRANSLRFRKKIDMNDIKSLTKVVNDSYLEDMENGKTVPKLPISELLITELLHSVSACGVNKYVNDTEEPLCLYNITASKEESCEQQIIKKDLLNQANKAISELSIIEQKVLNLRGIYL